MGFICPLCKEKLKKIENRYVCDNSHSFDISKYGYVNLLMSQKSSKKRHGDDKLMAVSRQDFLNKEYYGHLLCVLKEQSLKYGKYGGAFLDLGCGECYYSKNIKDYLEQNGVSMEVYGIDISKEILAVGARRKGDICLAVASATSLPFANESMDIVLNVFAPNFDEVLRVLKKDGIFIKAVPKENHLIELKKSLYDSVYLNKDSEQEIDGFELLDKIDIEKDIFLQNNLDIENLFKMTPYYYKTSEKDQNKLKNLDSLKVLTQFQVRIYKKI